MLPGGRGGEFLIVAAIALIVVGPKDLPKMLRQLGRFVGKMRAMADDFKMSFEDMARQSELDELRKEVEAMRSQNAPAVFNDISAEMKSFDSEINGQLSLDAPKTAQETPPAYPPVPKLAASGPAEPQPVASDPQMDGLPPKSTGTGTSAESMSAPKPRKPRKPAAKAVEAAPAEVTAADDVVVKPPRRRKGAS